MRAQAIQSIVLILLAVGVGGGCDSPSEPQAPEEDSLEPHIGPRGLQGVEGVIEGETVELPSHGVLNAPFEDVTGYDQHPFLEEGFVMLSVSGGLPGAAATKPLNFAIIRMPEGAPLAHHWLCAGDGSEMIDHGDATEGILRTLSDMGTCQGVPDGALSLNVVEAAYTGRETSWTGSPEFHLEGVYGSTKEGMFKAQTSYGRVMVWVDRAPYEEIAPDTAFEEVLEGAIFTTDLADEFLFGCSGTGSSVVTWTPPEGPGYEIEVDLQNASMVGQCPGTAVSGSLVVRQYYDQ